MKGPAHSVVRMVDETYQCYFYGENGHAGYRDVLEVSQYKVVLLFQIWLTQYLNCSFTMSRCLLQELRAVSLKWKPPRCRIRRASTTAGPTANSCMVGFVKS